jgi:aconitate decarboxylase
MKARRPPNGGSTARITWLGRQHLKIIEDGNPDPNALVPQHVEIDLADGRTVACSVDAVLGSPRRPLRADAVRPKFEMCWRAARNYSLNMTPVCGMQYRRSKP